ncbi:hypothetical protein KBZ08_00950 [Cyanobium sp. Candia 9D4]|uniref:hypothetical protein n=1 Tax=Cyanobium sp. Candia 9D4 TaxID=2823707 RepID=UPI0020CF8819|nr:hypothetical protein [Cyanobium sp. Candia 9D4]MCP9932475.1 hypothetical protein [Cyanobium sp. Candia 9D4]
MEVRANGFHPARPRRRLPPLLPSPPPDERQPREWSSPVAAVLAVGVFATGLLTWSSIQQSSH